MDLVKLYDCEYRDGRAETAPMLRKGASNKTTMADGADELGLTSGETQTASGGIARNMFGETQTSPNNKSGETWTRSATASSVNAALAQEEEEEHPTSRPRMPHIEMDTSQLDAAFPSIQAPEDDGLDDLDRDEADATLAAGLRTADEIARDMVQHGRTRRDGGPARGQPDAASLTAEPACALSCCATRRLALGDSLALVLPGTTTTLVPSGASFYEPNEHSVRAGAPVHQAERADVRQRKPPTLEECWKSLHCSERIHSDAPGYLFCNFRPCPSQTHVLTACDHCCGSSHK